MGDWLAWRPEWPVAGLAAVAWAVLAGHHLDPGTTMAPSSPGHPAHLSGTVPSLSLGWWTVMCVAMMVPLALPAARHVGLNSFRGHGLAGVTVFTTAFLVPWVGLGAVVLWTTGAALGAGASAAGLAAVVLAVAAGWQLSPWKRRAVLSCSRSVPLAPSGARAVATRLEFGVRQSSRCLAACWPLMAVMAVLPHGFGGLVAMAAATAAMVAEAQLRSRRRLIPWLAAPMALAALVSGVLA